jgi:hypothetical protein
MGESGHRFEPISLALLEGGSRSKRWSDVQAICKVLEELPLSVCG